MDTKSYIIQTLEKLVNIPSPSGFTKQIMDYIQQEAKSFGYASEYIQKGGLIVHVPGKAAKRLDYQHMQIRSVQWFARSQVKEC